MPFRTMRRSILGLAITGWIMSAAFSHNSASADGLATAVPPELQFMPTDVDAVLLVRPAANKQSKDEQSELGPRSRECQRIVMERAIHAAADGPDTLPEAAIESLMKSQQLLYFNRGFYGPSDVERCLIAFVNGQPDVRRAIEGSLRKAFPDVQARQRGELLTKKSVAKDSSFCVYLGELRKGVPVIVIANSPAILDEVIKRSQQAWEVRKVTGREAKIRNNNDHCKYLFCIFPLGPLPDKGGYLLLTSWLESGDSFRQRITFPKESFPETFFRNDVGPDGNLKDPTIVTDAARGEGLTAEAVFLDARTVEVVIKMGAHEGSAAKAAIGIMPVP